MGNYISLLFVIYIFFAHITCARLTPSQHEAQFSSSFMAAGDPDRTSAPVPTSAADEPFNNGQPFKILIQQVHEAGWSGGVTDDYYWLMPNGNTTVNCTHGATYAIQEGKLHIAGKIISTDVGVLNMAFEPRLTPGDITTQFFVVNGTLGWSNLHFTEGIAQFYKLPPGLLENALILSKFVGPMQPKRGWSPIRLIAKSSK